MTASFTPQITADELVAFVQSNGGTTSHQAAAHFGIRYACASSRLSKLAAYGRLRVRYEPRQPCGKFAIWSSI